MTPINYFDEKIKVKRNQSYPVYRVSFAQYGGIYREYTFSPRRNLPEIVSIELVGEVRVSKPSALLESGAGAFIVIAERSEFYSTIGDYEIEFFHACGSSKNIHYTKAID